VAAPRDSRSPSVGSVLAFDEARALGVVRCDDGTELTFHATAIANGSRQISVGTLVTFLVGPGHLGQFEARGLVSLPA
jgi:cold shock CspA family protein